MVPFFLIFCFIQFISFCSPTLQVLVFGILNFFFFLFISFASNTICYWFPCFLPVFCGQVIQFSSKFFDKDTMEYHKGLSDLSSERNTEIFLGSRVDKCETQLGVCMGTAICFDYC